MRRAGPWLAPVALMALIFVLSGQESLDSGLGWIDTVGRKLVHFAEYALLCGLWWRALRTVTSDERAILAALVIASAYAVSDEVHQSYVAGRNGSPVDWAIDSAGAATAAFALWRSRRAPSEVTT